MNNSSENLPGHSSRLKGYGLSVSEEIKPAQVINLGPCTLEKIGAMNDEREALRPAHGDIETVGVE
jgi:hypothetical protein